MNIFSVKGFLQFLGVVLIVMGTFGFIGILGPTASRSIFGTVWVFDNSESIAVTLLGVISIFATFLFPPMQQRYLVILIGIGTVLLGLYTFVNTTLLGAVFEIPADTIFLLAIGVWALYTVYGNAIGRAH